MTPSAFEMHRARRRSRRLFAAALVVGTSLMGCRVLPAARPAAETSATLADSLQTLRRAGNHDAALRVANQQLARLRADASAKPWQIREAESDRETMRFACTLPQRTRRELAAADSLEAPLENFLNRKAIAAGESAARRQLEIRARVLGQRHPDVAASQHHLAAFLAAKAEYAAADSLVREAIRVTEETLGNNHPRVASIMRTRAEICVEAGKIATADSLVRRALNLHRDALSSDDAEVLLDFGVLGAVLAYEGEYFAAEVILRRVAALGPARLPHNQRALLEGVSNLGSVVDMRGDHAAAEPLYRQATDLSRTLFGEESYDYAFNLANLAILSSELGMYATGESLLARVIPIYEKTLPAGHPDIAMMLQNQALLMQKRGHFSDAEVTYRRTLAMASAAGGRDGLNAALILNNLGLCLEEGGQAAAADSAMAAALAIRRRRLGKNHPDLILTLTNMAMLCKQNGALDRAEQLLEEAGRAFETARLRAASASDRAFFDLSPYEDLAVVQLWRGERAGAWPNVEKALARSLGDLLVDAGARPQNPGELAREDSLLSGMSLVEQQIAARAGTADEDGSDRRTHGRDRERLQLRIAEASLSAFQQQMATKYSLRCGATFDLARVQAALGPKRALLGWIEDPHPAADSIGRSWAYVIRDHGVVHWAELPKRARGRDVEWERVYRDAILLHGATGPRSRMSEAARTLYEQRVRPVESALEDIEELLVVPSRGMLGLPVEALVDSGGRLFGERVRVCYSPSASVATWLTEGTRRRHAQSRPITALLVGDPAFDAAQAEQIARETRAAMSRPPRAEQSTAEPLAAVTASALRSGAARGDGPAVFPRLVFSRLELERCKQLLGDRAVELLGRDASEPAMVALAESIHAFRILHFSTHAVIDDARPENCALVLSQVDLPDRFAAAERHERIYDGRWTAQEILQEWQLDADLVVLSACETALGRKAVGEGYIGFSQTLLQSGAHHLILSLWEVDDHSTALLMGSFYNHLLGDVAESTAAGSAAAPIRSDRLDSRRISRALQAAQRDVREYGAGDRHPYAHPWYWAGFVLIGAGD